MPKYTPMMEQYLEIKENYEHCLVFFRLGDFYELFFEDAVTASKELDLTLTGRDCGQKERVKMCGVPYHSADVYITKLVEKGYKVAIAEQVGDPKEAKEAKTIVKREVVRVVTPGTVIDPKNLEESKNNYIMCIYESKLGFGYAVADVTTGEFYTLSIEVNDYKKIFDEISKFSPTEILVNEKFSYKYEIENLFHIKPEVYYNWAFELSTARNKILNHFGIMSLEVFEIEDDILSICASGALLEYLSETQKIVLTHINKIRKILPKNFMTLDFASRRNLELCETMRDRDKKGTLLWVLNKTKTPFGSRLLRSYVEQPLIVCEAIEERLEAVEEIKNNPFLRLELKTELAKISDIERILSRVIYNTANGRDLVVLKNSFECFPVVKRIIKESTSNKLRTIYDDFDTLEDVTELIRTSIADEPPFSLREGNIIREGYNAELDTYREAKSKGNQWLLELENKEKQLTGIKTLKVKYNKVFGFFIEVTNSNAGQVPDRYVRKQTLSNCERFFTEELKNIEETILGADEKISSLEFVLFNEIRIKIADEIKRIQKTTQQIALLDVFQSFAEVADKNGYCKPRFNKDGYIKITGGRHPVVELTSSEPFVPNDTDLDDDMNRVAIITGPNMAGKSTYMRQNALIVLMAQMGSFVPADECDISVVDRVFTRVGASDDLATGQSTFMVEMNEVANILNYATKDSLLILDEIGRGTSTFDGLSIAWAILEYITYELQAKTLFATHYHELVELNKMDGVVNYCVTVEEKGDKIVFLRKIAKGHIDHSYGIHVAQIAGIPESVISRAKDILKLLESTESKNDLNPAGSEVKYGKYEKPDDEVHKIIISEIENMDIDSLTPREALKTLYNLKSKTMHI